ncbi:hypothetical protein JHV666_48890 [Mycobacterium avium subsp. hominissuis]
MHDMALTTRYAVCVLSPLRIDPWALTGRQSYWESIRFKPDAPSRGASTKYDGASGLKRMDSQ